MPRLLVILLFFYSQLSAQNQKPSVGPAPSWITNIPIDYSNNSMDADAENGYAVLDYEKQVFARDECTYFRFCERVVTEAGVQNESQISVNFDPTFQRLTFHTIKVVRGDAVVNQLQLSKIKIIQQEAELDNFIYNGTLKAVLFLEDVRKGDVIEYSYSLKGFNPIFSHKYHDVYDLQFSSPFHQLYYKLILPEGRSVTIKNTIDTIKPLVTKLDGQTVYEWKRSGVKALRTEDHLPSWYEVYPDVMVSEFKNWKEVNDWARTLFPVNVTLPAALNKKVKEIQQWGGSDESRLLQALHFVQDEIRYMGIEMGIHSHKPADPGKVFKQRFGDCKEKSYLLCCMLHAMGISAEPVLINTNYKKSIANWLPSPACFNHATVRVKLSDRYYYFDPTIAYQRGSIRDISYPDYQVGFVITDTTTTLTDIPYQKKGEVNASEVFDIPDLDGKAKLCVTTTYTGSYADDVRYQFKNNSNYEMLNSYKKFYASYFELITADSLLMDDSDTTGLLTTKEYYSIDSIWSVKNGRKKISLTSFVVQSILRNPKEKQRTMPFAIQFPAKYHESVVVNLPQEWDADPSEENIRCSAFMLNSKFSYSFRKIQLDYDFENFKDHVLPEEAKDFFACMNRSDESQGYYISYDEKKSAVKTESSSGFSLKPLYIFFLVVVLGISIIKLAQGK